MPGKLPETVGPLYYETNAFAPLRIESMTEQLRVICYEGYSNVLEVGVGKGLLKQFLSPFSSITHTSVDNDPLLNPDVVGSVLELPFKNNAFELTLCCQVLEHLPLENFMTALKELRRVTKHKVLLSIPDVRRRIGIAVCLPKLQWRKMELSFNRHFLRANRLARGHYWEIGYPQTPSHKVFAMVRKAGFQIEKTWRLEKHKWHCLLLLNCRKN